MRKNDAPKAHGRRLGQHFLFDKSILSRIVDAAEVSADDCILEVGPGPGSLTECLACRAGTVVAVELDRALMARLAGKMEQYPNVVLINGDIMKTDLNMIWQEHFGGRPFKVVANLPYYITTPIIMLFLESGLPVQSLTVMVQQEVADRLASPPGSRQYGSISVAVQYRTVVQKMFNVPASAFTPPPAVESAVLRLNLRDHPPVEVTDEKLFEKTVRGCFSSRRKTLRNNVSATFCIPGDDAAGLLEAAGIAPSERAERLGLQQFADLANTLFKAGYRGI